MRVIGDLENKIEFLIGNFSFFKVFVDVDRRRFGFLEAFVLGYLVVE